MTDKQTDNAVQTTGHAWDGDLQEFNNPLPRWWIWAFYASVAFALIYWILYPVWPVGHDYTKGVLTVSYESNGKTVTQHWNTRAKYIEDMQTGEESLKQKAYLDKVVNASYAAILSDPDMMAFTRSIGKGLFGDNCAACHGSGGNGVIGKFPNLVDDSWLWGGTVEDIHATISDGHRGFMPAFRETLNDEELEQVANYVLSLSGQAVDKEQVAAGDKIFNGQKGGCHYCHTHQAKGMKSVGSANLTDAIWSIADVPDASDPKGKLEAVEQVIRNGVQRRMPAWRDRLTPEQIKLLAVYVHELGGGK